MQISLEDKLRAYAAKGELVHISLVARDKEFEATFAAATPANGYSFGRDADPVEAIEKALKASPVKAPRAKKEVTAPVTPEREGALSSEWTSP